MRDFRTLGVSITRPTLVTKGARASHPVINESARTHPMLRAFSEVERSQFVKSAASEMLTPIFPDDLVKVMPAPTKIV